MAGASLILSLAAFGAGFYFIWDNRRSGNLMGWGTTACFVAFEWIIGVMMVVVSVLAVAA